MPPVPKDQRRTSPGRVYTFDTLREKGIPFSKNHIRRLVAKGKFPAPFYMSERRPAWSEAQLDAWIIEREVERDEDRAVQ
jgi:prophage regulatory protein